MTRRLLLFAMVTCALLTWYVARPSVERCIPKVAGWDKVTCGDLPWLLSTPCVNGGWATRTCDGRGTVEETWDE